jgi:hypothetical protein
MIFQQIRSTVSPGVTLPGTKYTVKGFGKRQGEAALVYRIPNRISGARPSEKGITKSEFEQAYSQLVTAGRFTRKWFNSTLDSAAAAPCNFMAVGGVFVMLGIANYKRGEFTPNGAKP